MNPEDEIKQMEWVIGQLKDSWEKLSDARRRGLLGMLSGQIGNLTAALDAEKADKMRF
jgi:hypothetical protein